MYMCCLLGAGRGLARTSWALGVAFGWLGWLGCLGLRVCAGDGAGHGVARDGGGEQGVHGVPLVESWYWDFMRFNANSRGGGSDGASCATSCKPLPVSAGTCGGPAVTGNAPGPNASTTKVGRGVVSVGGGSCGALKQQVLGLKCQGSSSKLPLVSVPSASSWWCALRWQKS